MCWKKKVVELEVTQMREYPFPKDRLTELFPLLDDYENNRLLSSKIKLWLFIGNIIPETKKGTWKIVFENNQVLLIETE